MQMVAQEATPIRGTTPRKNPVSLDVWKIYLAVFIIVGDSGLDGLAFNDCISIRTTSNGWFQQDKAPPKIEAYVAWAVFKHCGCVSSPLPLSLSEILTGAGYL